MTSQMPNQRIRFAEIIEIPLMDDATRARQMRAILRRLPPLEGGVIRIGTLHGLRDRHGAAHGGAFLRERRMVFDCTRVEFPRVFVHELFHFVWHRAGNKTRRSYGDLLHDEMRVRARGELGWSAEWRKNALSAGDPVLRSPLWRDYCCDSFCDTAAWLYSGLRGHPEFTLARRFRERRRTWFDKTLEIGQLSI